MKIYSKLIAAIFTLATVLTSCNSWIYDNGYQDCPQGVYLKYQAKSPCGDTNIYPAAGATLNIFAFDANDRLVSSKEVKNVTLTEDYTYVYEVKEGKYSFVTWVNADLTALNAAQVTNGVTTKSDLMYTLKKSGSNYTQIDTAAHVYQGAGLTEADLPIITEYSGAEFDTVYTNLSEKTNRVKVVVEGVDTNANFDAYFVLSNDKYKLNGEVQRVVADTAYLAPNFTVKKDASSASSTALADSTVSFTFKTLALEAQNLDRLVIKINDRVTINESLVGLILMRGDGQVRLACDRDFTVRLKVKEHKCSCGIYMAVAVYINDWLVHSYPVEL